jgi:signal transduction histidine kinase
VSSWSLRTRLTVLYGALFLLAGTVLLGVLYLLVRHSIDVEQRQPTDTRIAALRKQAAATGDVTITMPDGNEIAIDDLSARLEDDRERLADAALYSLLTQGGVAVVAVAGLAGAAGWLVAGSGLRPLGAITVAARRIAASAGAGQDLADRINLTGRNDEIRTLADSFDAMLDALDHAFDGQRRFTANASHELRTPLALERALIELEITKPTAAPETVQFGTALLAVNERHARLVDGLLTLTESQNRIGHPVPVDLDEVARHVIDSLRPIAVDKQVTISADLADACAYGDPVLLEQLTRNLVENAVRHNFPGGWAHVATRSENGDAVLQVANSGPHVAGFEVDGLFEPFRRRGAGRGPHPDRGSGLGLSIVKAITTTHAGHLTATPGEQDGLDITVKLPARPR